MDAVEDPLAQVYREQADAYERLVAHEDHQGNLMPALQRIRPSAGLDIADLGAGTGRLACMLAPAARSLFAADLSPAMLTVARQRLFPHLARVSGHSQGCLDAAADGDSDTCGPQTPSQGVTTPGFGTLRGVKIAVADHRGIPLRDASVDLAVSGWSLCYMAVWNPATWEREVSLALGEIRRILRPGGTVIVMETMGTGHTTPNPPSDLLPYFAYLDASGFASTWIRTDYAFTSRDEANAIAGFFFGESVVERCVPAAGGAQPAVTLPECTGIWWKTL